MIQLPYLIATEDFAALALNFQSVIMVLIVGIVHTGIAYVMYFGSMKVLKVEKQNKTAKLSIDLSQI